MRTEGGRRRASELAELADEVRLVGIAANGRERDPVRPISSPDPPQQSFETDRAGRPLRREADLLPEPGDQMLMTPSDLAADSANRCGPTTGDESLPCELHLTCNLWRDVHSIEQTPVDRLEALRPGRDVANIVAEPPSVPAKDVDEVHQLSREMMHRRAEQPVCAERRQLHLDIRWRAPAIDHREAGRHAVDELRRSHRGVLDLHHQLHGRTRRQHEPADTIRRTAPSGIATHEPRAQPRMRRALGAQCRRHPRLADPGADLPRAARRVNIRQSHTAQTFVQCAVTQSIDAIRAAHLRGLPTARARRSRIPSTYARARECHAGTHPPLLAADVEAGELEPCEVNRFARSAYVT